MKLFKIRCAQALCDFGLWILGLGPKDVHDWDMYRKLIELWRELERKKREIYLR